MVHLVQLMRLVTRYDTFGPIVMPYMEYLMGFVRWYDMFGPIVMLYMVSHAIGN